MNRTFFLILALSVMLPFAGAGEVRAASKLRDCSKEVQEGHANFVRKLRAQNFRANAASNPQEKARVIAFLEREHADTVKHEEAHKRVLGRWGSEIIYNYYEWWGKRYAITGCVKLKEGVPLNVALESALAPDRPSSVDQRVAEKTQQFIEIKKARAKCRKLKKRSAEAKCLKPYAEHRWLDRYPLD